MAQAASHKDAWKKVTIGSHFPAFPVRVVSKELFQKLRVPNQFVARIKDSNGDWTYGHAKISAGKVGACFSVNEVVVHGHDLPPQRKRSTRRSSSTDSDKPGDIEILTNNRSVSHDNSFVYEFDKLTFLKQKREIVSDDRRNTGALMKGRAIPFSIFGNLDYLDRQGFIAHKLQSEHVQDFENFEGSLVLYRRPLSECSTPASDSSPDCLHKSNRCHLMPIDGLVEVKAGVDQIPPCATCVPMHKLYGNVWAAPAVWYTEKDECVPGFAFRGEGDQKAAAVFSHQGNIFKPARGDMFQIHCSHSWDQQIEFKWCPLGDLQNYKLFHIDGQEQGLVPCVVTKRFQGLGSFCPNTNRIRAVVDEREGVFHEPSTLEHSFVLCYKLKTNHH